MANKKTTVILTHLLVFIVGTVFAFILLEYEKSVSMKNEKRAFDVVNHVMQTKLKEENVCKQFCTDAGFLELNKNWPSEANSFCVAIDDQFFGSYEGRIFFDTGAVYTILTSKREDGKDKLDSFERVKWPDRKKGDNYWGWAY